ncbi:MAG: hypothetical protein D6734_10785 [Candidatus Schekmanbacteria bacterium]|nr:MAG: hypothetical protein D6734_10785 [Candidatus Schekmanbacteria bacterium]
MAEIKNIHSIIIEDLKKKFDLQRVSLSHPFPERPLRTLGLVKIDGDVFTSEKFSRITCLRINLPFYFCVRSTFLRPKMEYDLPIFSGEVVIMGKKRMVMIDVHRTGEKERPEDAPLFDKLIKIRDKYPTLMENATKNVGEEIQNVFSRAVCQVKITESLDNDAINIFREYLGVFSDLVEKAEPLTGDNLEDAKKKYEAYLKTVVDHDPGVKGYKMLFGEEGGVKRSMEMFFES